MSSMSLSSPCMSDRTLLLSVEDLINIAMGPHEGNTVDFKMVQTVLHILARQMRLLEQKVVLVAGDLPVLKQSRKDDRRHSSSFSEESRSRDSITEDEKDGARSRKTSLEYRMEGKKDRRGAKSGSTVWQGRDGRKGGRDSDSRERSRGGRARDVDADESGGRRQRRGSREGDEEARRGGGRDRHKSGSRGRDGDDREKSRGRRGSTDDYDAERGGRGRSQGRRADDYDDEKGGRGRSGGRHADDYDDERGGRSKGRRYDDEDGKEGRGRSGGRGADDYDDEKGGRGRSHRGRDDEDGEDEVGGRGRSRGGYSDGHGRGSSRKDRDHDGDEADGRGRSRRGREDDEDDQDGRGRSRGRDADDRDYDDEKGGRGRSRGGRRDGEDGSEGRGRSGGRRDRDDEEASRGRGHGGRGRDDEDEKLGRGRDERRGEHGSPGGRSGRDIGEGGRDRGKEGIGIREVDGPGKDKLLVVVKSSNIGSDRGRDRRDSIAVVTQSQFRFLIEAVDELREMAGPLPALTMPDNKQLRKDLAAGASLTDTMQAMQVEARVKAAEEAIGHLGGLLTQLAASGALPSDALASGALPSDALASGALPSDALAGAWGPGAGNLDESRGALGSTKGIRHVTAPELEIALKGLKAELTNELQNPINKAADAAEAAETTAKFVGAKVEDLLKMVSRVNEMHTMVEEYAQQLDGFDAGLTTQMATFKEQMSTMRTDLQTGMAQLEAANNNPETAAVMELNERYEELVRGLEDTLLLHTSLTNTQHQLTLELKSLVESVEMLREQKADRDELMDGLRDKADMLRLEGLVRQEEFEKAREELEQKINVCHEKFLKQDEVWREVLKELEEQLNTKALVVDLMKVREEATTQLRDVNETIKKLELLLGEPEAAMLMRALSRGAVCGACLAPALMAPGDAIVPPRLPSARPAPPEQPCAPEHQVPKQSDLRTHKCHRWVGGSHTLLTHAHGPAAPPPALPDVTRKYVGYGGDGRLYWMETAIAPCVECNPEPPQVTARSDAGAGDADAGPVCTCSDTNVL